MPKYQSFLASFKKHPYKVSIIVPCYNTKPWLDECLQSLVDQTLQQIEIICVNDGSTDGTGDKLNEWQAKYPDKIKVIHQANGGLSNARNAGMAIAQGECLGFVDSDDFVDVYMYEKMYQVYKDNNADVVNSEMIKFHEKPHLNLKLNISIKETTICKDLLNILKNPPSICSGLYKKYFLQKHNINFVPNLIYEDLIFHFEVLIYTSKFIIIQQHLYFYRQKRINQLTSLAGKEVYDIFKVFEHIEKIKNSNKKNTPTNILNKYLLRYKIQNFWVTLKKANKKYKLDILYKSSNAIFYNTKSINVYKNLLFHKYRKPINYLLAFSILILFHCCFLWQKLPFIKSRKYISSN